MPEKIMKGIIEQDGSYHCLPGTDQGPLVGCLPMDNYTWSVSYFDLNDLIDSYLLLLGN